MRPSKKENEELRQKISELLAAEAKPLSQPEIAAKLELKQGMVWRMISGMLPKNTIAAISRTQNPELFEGQSSRVSYLFTIPNSKAETVSAPPPEQG